MAVSAIHTEGGVAANGDTVLGEVAALAARGGGGGDRRRVVLVGHSKGGLDALAAVAGMDPATAAATVAGVVCMLSPYGGTPVVGWLAARTAAAAAVAIAVERLWGGDPAAVADMGYPRRAAAWAAAAAAATAGRLQAAAGSAAEAAAVAPADDERETADGGGNPPPPSSPPARVAARPPPPPQVPVVTLASTAPFSFAAAIGSLPAAAGVASMGLPAGAVTRATGFYTDGLVAAADARVPGADWVVLGGLYHSAPALDVVGEVPGRRPGVLTAALLGLLLDRVEAREREARAWQRALVWRASSSQTPSRAVVVGAPRCWGGVGSRCRPSAGRPRVCSPGPPFSDGDYGRLPPSRHCRCCGSLGAASSSLTKVGDGSPQLGCGGLTRVVQLISHMDNTVIVVDKEERSRGRLVTLRRRERFTSYTEKRADVGTS